MPKLRFATSKTKPKPSLETWKILIVDDDESMISMTKLVLRPFLYQGIGLNCLEATSAAQARTVLQKESDIAVILLDVVMETPHAGLELIHYIRKELKNKFVRIILRTGQPGEAPEQEVILKYDINDYKLKTELTDLRLQTSIATALRSYSDMKKLEETYKKLTQEKERSRMAQYAKQQFLTNMSHELRTPLNGILGLTELISPLIENEDGKEYIQLIKQSGKGLLEVINNTLEMSEIEKGNISLSLQKIDIHDTLQKIMNIASSQARWKGLESTLEISDDVPLVISGDSKRLKQILVNQLSNAVRHTKEGHIALTVSVANKSQTENMDIPLKATPLLLAVEDTGIGIPADMQKKIFEPFSIGEDCLTKSLAGAGLGLSIASRLIKQMNGKIWVESSPGKGSTFFFIIPFMP